MELLKKMIELLESQNPPNLIKKDWYREISAAYRQRTVTFFKKFPHLSQETLVLS